MIENLTQDVRRSDRATECICEKMQTITATTNTGVTTSTGVTTNTGVSTNTGVTNITGVTTSTGVTNITGVSTNTGVGAAVMCAPILNAEGHVIAVSMLSNKLTSADADDAFTDDDEKVVNPLNAAQALHTN